MRKVLIERPQRPDEVIAGNFATLQELKCAVATALNFGPETDLVLTVYDADFESWVSVSASVFEGLQSQEKWRLRCHVPVEFIDQAVQTDTLEKGIVTTLSEAQIRVRAALPTNAQEAIELGTQKIQQLQETARNLADGACQKFNESGLDGVAVMAQAAVTKAAHNTVSRVSELSNDPRLAAAKQQALQTIVNTRQNLPSLAAALLQVMFFAATLKQFLDRSRNKASPLTQRLIFELLEVVAKKQQGTISIGPFRLPISVLRPQPAPTVLLEDAPTTPLPPPPALSVWADELMEELTTTEVPSESIPYPLVKAGKLYKKGDHGGFRLRHFELRGPFLFYFVPETVPDSADTDLKLRKGVIALMGTEVRREAVPRLGISIGGKALARKYVLEATTEEECTAWLDTLTTMAKRWAHAAPAVDDSKKWGKGFRLFGTTK